MHMCHSTNCHNCSAAADCLWVFILELLLKLVGRAGRFLIRWHVGLLLFCLFVFLVVLLVNTPMNSLSSSEQQDRQQVEKSTLYCRVQQVLVFTYKSLSPELPWFFQSLWLLVHIHSSVLSTRVQQGQHRLSCAFELLPCCASANLSADLN